MELKHVNAPFNAVPVALLIVPYGIETRKPPVNVFRQFILLIVPYGIETSASAVFPALFLLLIVPYGIETVIPCRCILPLSSF